ncbi:hypothetical protein OHA27_36460 [Streptomyces sp. NBC_01619]|uniref:group II intron reverse transcriptase/maturase n=1 Tax=Streptomyces sp. NBC_01619 TaxID=2975901 RepID=UPI00225425D6|nr:group II intron reverse transcriptase/maturase [Streptomyces sp. NBC_01619]MCX4515686.1 hypothetical protein [Streptomyces sp. NBC_01619]
MGHVEHGRIRNQRSLRRRCDEWNHHTNDFTIVAKYQAEFTGLVQYYLLAQDVFRLGRLQWVMETSMLKTLAGMHRSTVTKMSRKYKSTIETPDDHAAASRSPSPATRGRSHWSPASAGSRSSDSARQCSLTSGRSWPA